MVLNPVDESSTFTPALRRGVNFINLRKSRNPTVGKEERWLSKGNAGEDRAERKVSQETQSNPGWLPAEVEHSMGCRAPRSVTSDIDVSQNRHMLELALSSKSCLNCLIFLLEIQSLLFFASRQASYPRLLSIGSFSER
ncbi:hypothetical protein Acr_00g0015930 [Actinidia rufa]|uniref:Uncharacterized protein n=1 Tax=Actinidia rufa TaxID=165716 RepID=A0A7J0DCK4_9ERIC|nr:hypothetical protein Acr_00g0015930 [Actinidia rufa]